MKQPVNRHAVISHTRTLFRIKPDREDILNNIRHNFGDDCPYLNDVLEEIDRLESEQRKKELLAQITTATAQGMIDEMAAKGSVSLPAEYTVKGTATGRVIFESHIPKCTINTPLNYLKVKLIRRFPQIQDK